jgi:hypothetical protein
VGTYYAIGIVKKFEAKAKRAIDLPSLEKAVGERLDLSLFDLSHADGKLEGTLKPGLFEEHIEGFVDRLTEIAPDSKSTVRYCFESYGTDIDKYDSEYRRMRIPSPEGQSVDVRADMVLVFVEGKVMAESFSVEPVLMNWLFRHSDFSNPLEGAVVSGIIG